MNRNVKKGSKRLFSLLIMFVMLVSLIPPFTISAHAANPWPEPLVVTNRAELQNALTEFSTSSDTDLLIQLYIPGQTEDAEGADRIAQSYFPVTSELWIENFTYTEKNITIESAANGYDMFRPANIIGSTLGGESVINAAHYISIGHNASPSPPTSMLDEPAMIHVTLKNFDIDASQLKYKNGSASPIALRDGATLTIGPGMTFTHTPYPAYEGGTFSVIERNAAWFAPVDPARTGLTITSANFSGIKDPNRVITHAVYDNTGAPITILNTTFGITHSKYIENNNKNLELDTSKGGAIYTTGSLTVTNTTFEGNSAYNGGAVYIDSSAAAASFNNCNFFKNTATQSGGAIYSTGTVNLTDCRFWKADTVGPPTDYNNAATLGGGGSIYNTGTVNLTGTTIQNSTAGGNGGAIYSAGGTLNLNAGGSGNLLSGNTAGSVGDGGAIYAENTVLSVDGTTIQDNSAGGSGGGIYHEGGSVAFKDSTVARNSASGAGGVYHYSNNLGDTINFESGLIFGYGASVGEVVSGIAPSAAAAVILAWNKPAAPKVYVAGTNTDLLASETTPAPDPRWAGTKDAPKIRYTSDGESKEYVLTAEEKALVTLNKITLTKADITTTPALGDSATFAYTGSPIGVALSPIVKSGIEYIGARTYYTGTGGTSYSKSETAPTNAGSYTVSVTIDGDSAFEAAELTLGSYQITRTNKTLKDDTTLTVKADLAKTYSIDLNGLLPEGHASSPVFVPTIDADSENILASCTLAGDGHTLELVTNAAFAAGAAAAIRVGVTDSSDNVLYTNSGDVLITVNTTAKTPVTIRLTADPGIYTAGPRTGYTGLGFEAEGADITGALAAGTDYTIRYDGINGTIYTGAGAPVNVGEYRVTISMRPDHETYAGAASADFRISKAALTVTAESRIVSYGVLLQAPTVAYDRFAGPDDESSVFSTPPVPKYTVADSKHGNGGVVFDGVAGASRGTLSAIGQNYDVTYVPGTLTVTVPTFPDFQLTAISPAFVPNTGTRKITLSGNNFGAAEKISVTQGGTSFDIALPNAAVTVSNAGKTMVIDLSKHNNFNATGGYSLFLTAANGAVTGTRLFTVSSDPAYSQDAYAILAVFQNASTKKLSVELFHSESALSAKGTAVLTLRGVASKTSEGVYGVAGNPTLNKALKYKSTAGHPIIVTETNGNVTLQSQGYTDNVKSYLKNPSSLATYLDVLQWQGSTISTCGLTIELNSAYRYRTERLQTGTFTAAKGEDGLSTIITDTDPWRDVVVKRPPLGSGINLLIVSANLSELHLFDGYFSAKGGAKLNISLPSFITPKGKEDGAKKDDDDDDDDNGIGASLGFEMKDIIMNEKSGFPHMWLTGEAKLNLASLLKGEMGLVINTLPETYPNYFGMKGNLDIKEVFYVEGEFIFTYQDGLFLPEKLEFFARGGAGVPLVPPVLVAYANGFGGGVDGIARTYYGQYGQVPPISVKAMAAVKDSAGGALFDMEKASLVIGPSEVSLTVNEAKFLKILKLSDFGAKFGFRDSNPHATLPDPYIGFGGKLKIDKLKAGPFAVELEGGGQLDAVLHSYYLEDTIKQLLDKFQRWSRGDKGVSWTSYDSQRLADNMVKLIDAKGTAYVEAKLDLKLFSIGGKAEAGFEKSGTSVSLSGSVKGTIHTFLGDIEKGGSFEYKIDIMTGKAHISIDVLSVGDDAYATTVQLLELDSEDGEGAEDLVVVETISLTNIRHEGVFSLGAAQPSGGAANDLRPLAEQTPLVHTITDDGLSMISLTAASNTAVLTITKPASVGAIDFAAANADPEKLGTYTKIDDDSFTFAPVWTYSSEAGVYEGGLLLAGIGDWEIAADSAVTADISVLESIPELKTVTASAAADNGSVSWTYDSLAAAQKDDLRVKLFLLDADGNLVRDLIDATDDEGGFDITKLPKLAADGYTFTLPADLDSGAYQIQVQMLTVDGNVVSVMDSGVFPYANPAATGTVTGVKASYRGNGGFGVSWDAAAGADGYTVEILDKDGKAIDGVAAIDVSAVDADTNEVITSIVVGGGTVEVLDEAGNPTGETTGLPFGAQYDIRVRAYRLYQINHDGAGPDEKIAAGEEEYAKVHGPAGLVNDFALPVPTPPQLTVNVDGDKNNYFHNGHSANVLTSDEGSGVTTIYATNDTSGKVTVHADASVAWTWAYEDPGSPVLDEETGEIAKFNTKEGTVSGMQLQIDIPDLDGTYSIYVTAANAQKDAKSVLINLHVDTAAPALEVDEASSLAAEGKILLNGLVEYGAELFVDGAKYATDTESNFGGLFSVQRTTNRLVTGVDLLAADTAGNVSTLAKEMLMTDTGQIVGVDLTLENGRKVLGVGNSAALELWAIYDNGKRYILDDDSVVYTITDGGASVTFDGTNNTITAKAENQSVTIHAEWILDPQNTLAADLVLGTALPVDAATPNITGQPRNAHYTVGDTATALTVAANVSDGGELRYQWYESPTNTQTDGYLLSGATGASFTPPTSRAGTLYYYCIVTNKNVNVGGNMLAAAASGAAAITVNPGGGNSTWTSTSESTGAGAARKGIGTGPDSGGVSGTSSTNNGGASDVTNISGGLIGDPAPPEAGITLVNADEDAGVGFPWWILVVAVAVIVLGWRFLAIRRQRRSEE